MSLPPEYRTPEMEAVSQKMATMTPEEFSALRLLTDEDHHLIGRYIQSYNFIDFNLRRSIELFWHTKMLPSEHVRRYPKYNDAELSDMVAQVVETMDGNEEDIPKALEWLALIKQGRPYRNLMGHFAAKRMDGDIIIFASKNERDAERAFGRRLQRNHIFTASTTAKALHDLNVHIAAPSNWIAFKYAEWCKRYDKS